MVKFRTQVAAQFYPAGFPVPAIAAYFTDAAGRRIGY